MIQSKKRLFANFALWILMALGSLAAAALAAALVWRWPVQHSCFEVDPGLVNLIRALAWPLVTLGIIGILFINVHNRIWVEGLLLRFKRVKAFNVEFELTEEKAREVRTLTQDAFRDWRKNTQYEFDRIVNDQQIELVVKDVTEALKQATRNGDLAASIRATIYIPDPLFSGMLYQLIDYYPRQATGGRGRIISERFGIVGLAWRSRLFQHEPDVSTKKGDLVKEWGMRETEATGAAVGRKSFLALPIHIDANRICGVLYMDAIKEDTFKAIGDNSAIQDRIQRASPNLTDIVREISSKLRKFGPQIDLTGAL